MLSKNLILIVTIFYFNLCLCEEKTIPGAIALLPAVTPVVTAIGSALPALTAIGSALPVITKPPALPSLPPISISHASSLSANVNNKPYAISHSGSFANSISAGHTSANGQASSWTPMGGGIQSSSSAVAGGNKIPRQSLKLLSNKRWNKILFNG